MKRDLSSRGLEDGIVIFQHCLKNVKRNVVEWFIYIEYSILSKHMLILNTHKNFSLCDASFLFLQGESGMATTYISRNKALKKLQLSLPDFRYV